MTILTRHIDPPVHAIRIGHLRYLADGTHEVWTGEDWQRVEQPGRSIRRWVIDITMVIGLGCACAAVLLVLCGIMPVVLDPSGRIEGPTVHEAYTVAVLVVVAIVAFVVESEASKHL